MHRGGAEMENWRQIIGSKGYNNFMLYIAGNWGQAMREKQQIDFCEFDSLDRLTVVRGVPENLPSATLCICIIISGKIWTE